jgi:hypothetical protein
MPALLILVVVRYHQGEQLLLYTDALPHIVFLVGNERDALNTINEMLPDLLLLDDRLPEKVENILIQRIHERCVRSSHEAPLVANVQINLWQETNRGTEYMQDYRTFSWKLESLLVTAIVKDAV